MRLRDICENTTPVQTRSFWGWAFVMANLALTLTVSGGTVISTPPEKWLPDDTLCLIAARDPGAVSKLVESTGQGRLWKDPALREFKEKFTEGWERDVLKPLERDVDLDLKKWMELVNGPVVWAVVKGDASDKNASPGWILAAETGDKSATLKKELTALRQRWFSSGKQVRTVQVRDLEFTAVSFGTNGTVGRLKRFLPKVLEVQELGQKIETNQPSSGELFAGQSGSLLILSSSTKTLEKVLLRLSGGTAPVLQEQAAYDACHKRLFTSAPVYGWLNARASLAQYAPPKTPEASTPPPPSPVDVFDKAKFVQASGLGALRAIGFAFSQSTEGIGLQVLLNVPEAERTGLLKILAGQPKPCDVPTFVPADVAEFQRWRMDGPDSWASVQKMMGEISPQWSSAMNFIIETANEAAQFKDPGFDVRKNLVANLGDDIITYSKTPKLDGEDSGGSLMLVSSPNPTQLAAALQRILIFLSAEAENPAQREFLGRTIYSVPLPSVPMPLGEQSAVRPGLTLHYAATSSYVVLSTAETLLEEHLRSADSQMPGLRDNPDLKATASKVTNPGTSMFSYKNQAILEKAKFAAVRASGVKGTNILSSLNALSWLGLVAPEDGAQNWMDLTLLPPFERISKYFHIVVRSTSANSEGITFSWFYPEPPALRREGVAGK